MGLYKDLGFRDLGFRVQGFGFRNMTLLVKIQNVKDKGT